jgi:hypothetical protein
LIHPPRRRVHPSGSGYASVQNAYKPSAFFDLLGAFYSTYEFHGSFAARALERVGSPYFEDEVTPEGSHGPGGLFWWGGDEKDFRLGIVDFGLLI